MLLENIFATALSVLLVSMMIMASVNEDKAFEKKIFFYSVIVAFFLSGLVTIITAIWWIVRAWG